MSDEVMVKLDLAVLTSLHVTVSSICQLLTAFQYNFSVVFFLTEGMFHIKICCQHFIHLESVCVDMLVS